MSLLLAFVWAVGYISAVDVVYVTDLSLYSSLAPCAASAISNNIRYQTFSKYCSEAVTDLQSCVCSKRFDDVSTTMSLMISVTCGSTASEDQASASTVLKAYCDQDWDVEFPKPKYPVSSYIDEISAMTELAPCASIRLSGIVNQQTEAICPYLATDLAPCVCEKNQNSLRVSEMINTGVGQLCSSNKDDIKSAQAMFAAYCAMNSGKTSFPTASSPPGDMSYYVTNLPQYSSLETCAQLCVDIAAMYQTSTFCPGGPQALASCLCLKNSVSKAVSSTLSWEIKNRCHKNMLDNLSSANAVLDYYCSAAKGEVTATGIAVSQTESASTGAGSGSMATETNSSDESESKSKGPSAGVIAGAVVGAVVGVLIGGGLVFLFMRKRARSKKQMKSSDISGHHSQERIQRDDGIRLNPVAGGGDEIAPPPYEERPSGAMSSKK
ncbi:hypothetical protein CEP53_011121 [Fusarium sp. AF-6]|nr:hypothetical protein CEP53_011121 [Fusarium sp. AF-6]